ncbi:YARHG domain-containing protein [Mesorhizobium sp. NBSH29]|uniref:YARHG domain-containing protein n=1 Tax=Mesorhizobium sp. NBSH29 TaxID=2654249 RepID=UPI0018963FD9|nr:YARHG domain-containing protein [Mesorhizobium sp. NBSH29]QPC87491.1 YARHG domain-containing protein [Mesorhizobium sp. NBSH29]
MRFVFVAVFALAALPGIAQASCYEDLGATGCTDSETFPRSDLRALSCENLWQVRNSIYNEAGFCFKTSRAKAQFDNSDCSVNKASSLRMNSHERANVSRISQVEKEKGCRM